MSETPDASFDYGWGQESVASPSSENSGFAHKRSASCLSEELADRPIKSRKPMRKRAKTQEEKEQRAQERVMRNRAAAQVSRERKREYVTTLEVEKEELNERLSALTGENKSLQETVSTLTQRLETMERMLAYLTPQAPVIPDALGKTYQPLPVQEDLFELPTPPGTIRPQDMQSVTSTPVLETLDLRNPAVIANGPQRRSMMFPWTISSRSPMYRQMESILVFWTTLLRLTTLPTFATLLLTSARLATFQKGFAHDTLPHRRFLATCPESSSSSPSGKGVSFTSEF